MSVTVRACCTVPVKGHPPAGSGGATVRIQTRRRKCPGDNGKRKFPFRPCPLPLPGFLSHARAVPTHLCPLAMPGDDLAAFLHRRGPPRVTVGMKKQKQSFSQAHSCSVSSLLHGEGTLRLARGQDRLRRRRGSLRHLPRHRRHRLLPAPAAPAAPALRSG